LLSGSLLSQATQIGTVTQQQTCLAQSITAIEANTDQLTLTVPDRLTNMDRDIRALEQRLLKLLPILTQLRIALLLLS
jgi:hypothetical protein